ncbi:MAG: winged helix-turn-helix domain-containing protein [Candidatus Acidiferrum sp.]|jgi:TolB-like protein/DNA-binding winged helix-turn-helix (wHTH) protein
MDRTTTNKLQIGDWLVNPASGEITRNGETARLEARSMRLLVCLAEHAGEVVSIDELLNQAWAGVIVSSDSVYQAVTSLRRQLGDDAKQPTYIETVPRLGYRMVAKVRPWVEPAESTNLQVESSRAPDRGRTGFSARTPSGGRIRAGLAVAGSVALCIALVAMSMLQGNVSGSNASASAAAASQPEKSIAVVPFLDLTEGMVEETFADGMTEELIDKLGKIPELMVPSATASFYYKNKKIPVAELARKLHVIYLLDGSVRKAGARVRVAARLIRADNGYVIWTETYDRPFDDILMVQDDIAGKVTAALRKSIR